MKSFTVSIFTPNAADETQLPVTSPAALRTGQTISVSGTSSVTMSFTRSDALSE